MDLYHIDIRRRLGTYYACLYPLNHQKTLVWIDSKLRFINGLEKQCGEYFRSSRVPSALCWMCCLRIVDLISPFCASFRGMVALEQLARGLLLRCRISAKCQATLPITTRGRFQSRRLATAVDVERPSTSTGKPYYVTSPIFYVNSGTYSSAYASDCDLT